MDKSSIKNLEELIDSVSNIDGFPLGNQKDIISLSDPPFYTACPNPYLKKFIEEYGKPYNPKDDGYEKEPFLWDVSEGKNNPIYKAHSYHTKVPYKAIIPYIEHYTKPGDIVFDGFCGTGMIGLAASFLERNAIISDLSPFATFIANNYNHPINPKKYEEISLEILNKINKECSWMYETNHSNSKNEQTRLFEVKGKINYVVWSDILACPYCKGEFIFYDVAFDKEKLSVREEFHCEICNANLTKRECNRVFISKKDLVIRKTIKIPKESPVLINYSIGKDKYEKIPDEQDLEVISKINNLEIPYWFPSVEIPKGDKTHEFLRLGYSHSHQLFSKRALYVISLVFDLIQKVENKHRSFLLFTFEQLILGMSKIARYVPTHYSQVNQYLSGTIYVSSLRVDPSPDYMIRNKITRLKKVLIDLSELKGNIIISTQSITKFPQIPDNSIDYIFIDPPFGSNLMYSELSFINETWLRVLTNTKDEAIINKAQNKELLDYKKIMTLAFKEMNRMLKPNRWITIEFHNSKASVWNGIQESISRAGFIIAQVAVLDKKQGSFNQVSSPGAVKNDLVINAYKPSKEFIDIFISNAGREMENVFLNQHLEHLPVRPNIERTEKMLYSKMLAHYVENGFKIKYNASTLYNLLSQNYIEIDGYWFNDNQVKKYNEWKKNLSLDQMKDMIDGQQILFVNDEKSAIVWLSNFLNTLKSFSEISTAYNQILTKTTDNMPELKELLKNNFIFENDKYRRPMGVNEKQTINNNRMSELKRVYNNILSSIKEKKGKIKIIRKEALIYGFNECYNQGNYEDILKIADKLHKNIIESSGALMDFIDIAKLKTI